MRLLAPGPFTGTRDSFARYVDALTGMSDGATLVWLAPFAPPQSIGAQYALVLPTSGSTGAPKAVAHTLPTLRASQTATAEALGGHGAWLPFLPPTHIAGVQVVARALRTAEERGLTDPHGALGPLPDLGASFTARTVLEAMEQWDAPDGPLFTSFVPTQLERLLRDPDRAVLEQLRRFSAILVGGAATPAALLRQGRDLGLRLVTTYGSSETAGGCVYSARPLPGVDLSLDDEGRLVITAPCVARGYLSDEGELSAFESVPSTAGGAAGVRRFVTSDLADLGADGTLSIRGRADHVIITGGAKVNPVEVEQAICQHPSAAAALVTSVPDDEWGQKVVALVVPAEPAHPGGADVERPGPELLRETVPDAVRAARLGSASVPKITLVVDDLPMLAPGKVDRVRAADLARRLIRE
ncbi:AMP-binding protein [Helcobacillus sp. ACRRO]|uniref:AMP-binding protein n=1 Tax=Helcobacillus sp. ACRRO TaxID=2918202 RepID=UPI001EF6A366|nr:AMP-binding protein [Helcobacillus sp. ACRRO]MCG7427988.1 AMP-binding protein [Helcobacillus sp. ACRRO]